MLLPLVVCRALCSCVCVSIGPPFFPPQAVCPSKSSNTSRHHRLGKQHYLDATVAYKRAVLNCIDYLSKFGYTKSQVRVLSRLFLDQH